MLGAAAGEPLVIFADAMQSRHGRRRGRQVRHQDDQGPQGQESRDLAGLHAGSRDPRAPAHGRHDASRTSSRSACRSPTWRRALARGDVDAYVGAEPAPGISLANGVGKIVEYPVHHADRLAQHGLAASQKARRKEPRARQADGGHAPQGDRLRDVEPDGDRRHGGAEARPEAQVDRARRAERRARLEDRRRVHEARERLRAADAREQADPRGRLDHQASSSRAQFQN